MTKGVDIGPTIADGSGLDDVQFIMHLAAYTLLSYSLYLVELPKFPTLENEALAVTSIFFACLLPSCLLLP